MAASYKRLKAGCYMSNVCMSIVSAFIPLLFVAFHDMYDISYTYLGALVLINFVSQLSVDLIYSFFSSKLNIEISVKLMPVIMLIGLIFIALVPLIMEKYIYLGIVIGTIIISASSGIAEVLISRVIAAIPSDKPDYEMSKLHSIYAFGVVGTVLVCTVFLKLFGYKYWQVLSGILCVVPISAIILYVNQEFPRFVEDEEGSGSIKSLVSWEFLLCVLCIFLGGATENTMSQWSSSYLEKAIGLPKIYGDLFGVALFAVFLGVGRMLYAKIGKKITRVLVLGAIGSLVCYLIAALSKSPIIALIACALTGFTSSMLWPGTIIAASPKFQKAGVAMFAMLAAGGDLGASIAPQLMGALTDKMMKNTMCIEYSINNSIPIDMVAMRVALLCVAVFPLILVIVSLSLHIIQSKQKNNSTH